jgi:precorrin-3B C17-methyltransferase
MAFFKGANKPFEKRKPDKGNRRMLNTKVFVVGIGPGEITLMTGKAHDALLSCDIIIGYEVYINLIAENFPGKEFIASPMTKETERCELAAKEALAGKTVAVISSGDAGVYGMAGIMLETAHKYGVEVEVIPGVTAALAGGAVLGAPLTNDFAVISLSDLLTPWSVIEKRLKAAAAGDFAVAIYNPGSTMRREHLKKACRILLEHKSPDTPCGIVRNIGRSGQEYRLTTLAELVDIDADMFMTIFIGNDQTVVSGGKMITKRGYKAP